MSRCTPLCLALALLAACGSAERPAADPFAHPPARVILVTIDTLRADHLAFYGYPRSTAPFLEGLAQESVVFERVVSSSSHTNPAHASIFTGLLPPQHKVLHNGQVPIAASITTLAEMFAAAGYDTAAFYGVPWLARLDRGFRHDDRHPKSEYGPRHYFSAQETVDRARAWLAARSTDDGERFFLWIHFFDPHIPYTAPGALRQEMGFRSDDERKRLLAFWTGDQHKDTATFPVADPEEALVLAQNGYDAEIRFVDQQLERLYRTLDEADLLADSLWVVTADHGEGLGDHKHWGHSRYVYQEQLRVPLLVYRPDGDLTPRRVGGLVRHVDLFPTLQEIIGAGPAPDGMRRSGVSLVPALRGAPAPSRLAFSQRAMVPPHRRDAAWEPDPVFAIQDEETKFVFEGNGRHQLYDLRTDPHELDDRMAREPERGAEWLARARDLFARLGEGAEHVESPALSDEHREELRALGYLD